MISVKPNYEYNTFTFQCSTTDEFQFVKENEEKILDKFVESEFKNIGKLAIHTWSDYLKFCNSSPIKQLEMYEGHKIQNPDETAARSGMIIANEASKGLSFSKYTEYRLERLANEMFQEQQLESKILKDA
jgi:hypothetical protein